jgi:hypothetical protein
MHLLQIVSLWNLNTFEVLHVIVITIILFGMLILVPAAHALSQNGMIEQ